MPRLCHGEPACRQAGCFRRILESITNGAPIFLLIFFLISCTPLKPPGSPVGHGGGHAGGGVVQEQKIGKGSDLATLPEAKPSGTIEVSHGGTITLEPMRVRKKVEGKSLIFFGYNGQLPGPLIKTTQGSTFTVQVKNSIAMPTTIHWHGVRLENKFDGVPDVTQKAIEPGATFTYTVSVPDEGMYWYHPHVREDVQQDLGLYGALLVRPLDPSAYNPVNREEVLFLDDILLDRGGEIVPYGEDDANFALMGRFGNTLLVNSSGSYALSVKKGELVRFFFLNAANARTFRLSIPGVRIKLIGGDGGRLEEEESVKSITLSSGERSIADVLFATVGEFPIQYQSSEGMKTMGKISVGKESISQSFAQAFPTIRTYQDITASINPFRSAFGKPPEKTLTLDLTMHKKSGGHGGGHGGGKGGLLPPGGIEWEDPDSTLNAKSTKDTLQWELKDNVTGLVNEDLLWTFNKGDAVKIRLVNKENSAHPMQHPIHFHGQRFLVLKENTQPNENLVWKDTVLVKAGQIVEILLDASNPGDWMFHCHISEHLTNGMMGMMRVE